MVQAPIWKCPDRLDQDGLDQDGLSYIITSANMLYNIK